ncbi:MAG: hypothetical protein L0332_31320 [Chloroflexi bacterium]|nr:hypothetical protein [Chloroflexota bacterium]MCI0650109.1 hypothetical protein [Chloroflexota bacterium]MCI0731193.1 hypothetical protein [Chloroflexota bacterium]
MIYSPPVNQPTIRAKRPSLLILLALLCLLLLPATTGRRGSDASPGSGAPAASALGRLLFSFIPNAGQSNPAVRFQAHSAGSALFFTQDEVVLTWLAPAALDWHGQRAGLAEPATELLDSSAWLSGEALGPGLSRPTASPQVNDRPAGETTTLRLRFLGVDTQAAVEGEEKLPGVANILRGNDPGRWQTKLPTFAAVSYVEPYEGVSLRFSGRPRALVARLTVAPQADLGQVRWRYDGTAGLELAHGELLLTLPGPTGAPVTAVQSAPLAV